MQMTASPHSNPRRDAREELWVVRIVALLMIAIGVGLALNSIGFRLITRADSSMNEPPGADFVNFYAAAKLVRTAPRQVYDPVVQRRVQRDATGYPVAGLVFAHAPFFAVLLAPLSMLPFQAAYVTWMAISTALYGLSVAVLAPRRLRRWALPFAFACPIFPVYVAAAGQVSAVACAAVAFGIHLESRGKPYLSGLALSLCAHKPVLPAFIIIMLAVTGRFRALLGMLAGITGLAVISFLAVGGAGCVAWIKLLFFYENVARLGQHRLIKYVDLNTFQKLLPVPAPVAIAMTVAGGIGVAALFIYVLKHRVPATTWAATLTSAVLLSPYTPVYEGILLVVALILIARLDTSDPTLALIILTCIAGLGTQATAALFGVPLLTLVGVLVSVRTAQISRAASASSSPVEAGVAAAGT